MDDFENRSRASAEADGAVIIYSLAVEQSIAVAYLVRSIRRCLCIVPWALFVFLLFATVTAFVIIPKYCDDHFHMLWGALGMLGETFFTCTCLVIVAYRARHSSHVVAERHRRGAVVWIANSLLSNVPMAITGLVPFALQQPDWLAWTILQGTLMSSKGALNTLAIFSSSRYSNADALQNVHRTDVSGSFNVHWAGHEEIVI